MQPLAEFLLSARTQNFDNQDAVATRDQRLEERGQAWTKLAPVLSAVANDNINQYQSAITLPARPGSGPETVVITPKYQRNAEISLSVPLVDIGNWKRIGAARSTADAAEARRLSTKLETDKAVTRAYYQLVAASNLVIAAQRSLAVATETVKIVQSRKASGVASLLDLRRAESDEERARQSLADAEYTVATSRRSLQTLTGLVPTETVESVVDDLHPEASLATWEGKATLQLPAVAASIQESEAAEKQIAAARAAYLPTLAGNLAENYANSAGLIGQERYYTVGLTLNWRLDPGTHYATTAQEAAWAGAKAREGRAVQGAKDDIFVAWQQVVSQIAKSRSARAEQTASDEAARLTQDRYRSGTATLLDVIEAQRDAFTAAVSRIQADGDLVVARAVLRLAAGDAPEEGTAPPPQGGRS